MPVTVLDLIPREEWPAIEAGTSTYDTTPAWQAALDTRAVYAPAGRYRTTAPLTASGPRGLDLTGDGPEATILDPQGFAGPALRLVGGAPSVFHVGARLAGFAIAPVVATPGGRGLDLDGVWLAEIARVRLEGLAGDGVRVVHRLGDPDATAHVTLRHCRIQRTGGLALRLNDADLGNSVVFVTVEQSYLAENAGGGIAWAGQFLTVDRCSIYGNRGVGGLWARYGVAHPQMLVSRQTEYDSNTPQHIRLDAVVGAESHLDQFNAQDDGSGFGFRPAVSVVIGDGVAGHVARHVAIRQPRLRLSPPDAAHVAFDVRAGAEHARIEDPTWQAFAPPAVKLRDAGRGTILRDPA